MIEMTGVESKIEGLIEVLREDEGRILEICRSGKMTMRRGHHTSGVLRAMGAGARRTCGAPQRRADDRRESSPASRSNIEDCHPEQRRVEGPAVAFVEQQNSPELSRQRTANSKRKTRENHGQDLLRSRCRPLPHPGQESGHHRLRLPGARPRPQPQGLRRPGKSRPRRQLQVHRQGAEGRP